MRRVDIKKMKKWNLITTNEYKKALKKRANWQIRNNQLDSINSRTSNISDYAIFNQRSALAKYRKAPINVKEVVSRLTSGES